jgi:hypothetical protein
MTDPAPPWPAVTRRQVLLGSSLLSVGLLAWGSSRQIVCCGVTLTMNDGPKDPLAHLTS